MTWTLLALLAACDKDDEQSADTDAQALDSAASEDSQSDPGGEDSQSQSPGEDSSVPCVDPPVYDDSDPEEGDSDFFWRSPLEVEFEGDGRDAAVTLVHLESGVEVPWDKKMTSWNADYTEVLLQPKQPLQPLTEYRLDVASCDATTSVHFSTSEFGSPVEGGGESLVGRSWVVPLGEISYTKPEGIGFVLSATLNTSILIGVQQISGKTIDLIGVEGNLNNSGEYYQPSSAETWDFSGSNWDDPYFYADRDSITLNYEGIQIPLHNFHLEGTFAPDGSSFAQGVLWALADTREMGQYVGGSAEDEDAVCELLSLSGIECEACPDDGEAFCIFLQAEKIDAAEVEGLTIED